MQSNMTTIEQAVHNSDAYHELNSSKEQLVSFDTFLEANGEALNMLTLEVGSEQDALQVLERWYGDFTGTWY